MEAEIFKLATERPEVELRQLATDEDDVAYFTAIAANRDYSPASK